MILQEHFAFPIMSDSKGRKPCLHGKPTPNKSIEALGNLQKL